MKGVDYVNKYGYMRVVEPTEEKKEQLNNAIIQHTGIHKSQRENVEEILDVMGVSKAMRSKVHNLIQNSYGGVVDRSKLQEIISTNIPLMS